DAEPRQATRESFAMLARAAADGRSEAAETTAPESAARKSCSSLFHSISHCPVGPCRLRTSVASNRRRPQFSSFRLEHAARISQRVSAALGSGSAEQRRRKTLTPEQAAASTSLRLAERSSAFTVPG